MTRGGCGKVHFPQPNCRSAGVTEHELPVYRRALETLASSGMVVEHSSLIAEQADHA